LTQLLLVLVFAQNRHVVRTTSVMIPHRAVQQGNLAQNLVELTVAPVPQVPSKMILVFVRAPLVIVLKILVMLRKHVVK
jgi:hypothetical protein